MIGIFEQRAGCFQTTLVQVLDRRKACVFGKRMSHIIFIHMGQTCKSVQGNMLGIVIVQVFLNVGTFFRHSHGLDRCGNQALRTDDTEDQNFQKLLADGVRGKLLVFYFMQNLYKQVGDQSFS